MSWTGVWSHKIDGVEVNVAGQFIVQVPQLETGADDDVVLVPVDGRAPAYIRNQQKEAIYSFLISIVDAVDWPTWAARRATLFGIFANGPHTYTVQARGMATPLSTTIIVRGRTVDAKARQMTVNAVVPVPIF